jgi:hypothetical protein
LNIELNVICGEGRIKRSEKIGRNECYELVVETAADLNLSVPENNAYEEWVKKNKRASLPCLERKQKVKLITYAWRKLRDVDNTRLNGLVICKNSDEIEMWVRDLNEHGIKAGAYGGNKSEWLGSKNFCVSSSQKAINRIKGGGLEHIKSGLNLLLIMDECDGYVMHGKSSYLFTNALYWLMHFPDQTSGTKDVYDLPPWLRVSNVKK